MSPQSSIIFGENYYKGFRLFTLDQTVDSIIIETMEDDINTDHVNTTVLGPPGGSSNFMEIVSSLPAYKIGKTN